MDPSSTPSRGQASLARAGVATLGAGTAGWGSAMRSCVQLPGRWVRLSR